MMRVGAAASIRIGLLLLLAVGCGAGAESDPGPDGGSGPRVVLGTGVDAFEALAADGTVPLIKGIQNGFHVWTSFLAYGFDTDVLRMELTTRWDAVDESILEMAGNVAVRPITGPDGEPALVSLGWPASIFNPACSNGRRLQLDLTVRDTESGLSASDSRHWIVAVAEADRSPDCAP